ncbi:unnamed protein product, partial [Phaeothamnion confervicola]
PAERHWKVGALWDYWRTAYDRLGRAPRRADVDPIDIPKLLANLWIVDWENAARFRYRLIGTAVTRAWNRDMTGRYLDDDIPGFAATALGRELAGVVRTGRPAWSKGPPTPRPAVDPVDVLEIERLALPLAADDGSVAMVLCLSVYWPRIGDEF